MKTLLVLLVACGSSPPPHAASPAPTLVSAIEQGLVDAVQRNDVAAILKPPIAFGGLWFADPHCARQFPTKTSIEAARVSAFATCLATLSFDHASRGGESILTYKPGIQVGISYVMEGGHPWITGIGHTVVESSPETARITPRALVLREGSITIVPEELDKIFLTQHVPSSVKGSFELCIDKTGAVQRVAMLRSTGLLRYNAKIMDTLRENKYEPIVIGEQTLAACTAVTFIFSMR